MDVLWVSLNWIVFYYIGVFFGVIVVINGVILINLFRVGFEFLLFVGMLFFFVLVYEGLSFGFYV